MYCEKCGKEVSDSACFCSACGHPVAKGNPSCTIEKEKGALFNTTPSKTKVVNILGFLIMVLFAPQFFIQLYTYGLNYEGTTNLIINSGYIPLLAIYYAYIIFVVLFTKFFKETLASKVMVKTTLVGCIAGSFFITIHLIFSLFSHFSLKRTISGTNPRDPSQYSILKSATYASTMNMTEIILLLVALLAVVLFLFISLRRHLKEKPDSRVKDIIDKLKNSIVSLDLSKAKAGLANFLGKAKKPDLSSLNNFKKPDLPALRNLNKPDFSSISNLKSDLTSVNNIKRPSINLNKKAKNILLVILLFVIVIGGIKVLYPYTSIPGLGSAKPPDRLTELVTVGDVKALATFLLENEPDLNAKNQDGLTPLAIAVTNGNTEVVQLLLESGADVNSQVEKGYTPIMYAIKNSNTEMAQLLNAYGADAMIQNDEGLTAIDLLIIYENREIKLDIPESLGRVIGKWEGMLTTEETSYGQINEYPIGKDELIWSFFTNGKVRGWNNAEGVALDANYTFDGNTLEIHDDQHYEVSEVDFNRDAMYVTSTDRYGNKYTLSFIRKAPTGILWEPEEYITSPIPEHQALIDAVQKSIEKDKPEIDSLNDLFGYIGKDIEYLEEVIGKEREYNKMEFSESEGPDDYLMVPVIKTELYTIGFSLRGDIATEIFLNENAEVQGVKVGMTIDEIKEVIGEPEYEGYSWEWPDAYEIWFSISGFRLGFYSNEANGVTISGYIDEEIQQQQSVQEEKKEREKNSAAGISSDDALSIIRKLTTWPPTARFSIETLKGDGVKYYSIYVDDTIDDSGSAKHLYLVNSNNGKVFDNSRGDMIPVPTN